MAVWDTLANIQNIFKRKPDVTDTPTHNQNGWVKFGVALDIVRKIPVYPGSVNLIINDAKDALNNAKNNIAGPRFNDQIEKARVAALTGVSENIGTTQGLKTLPATGAALGLVGGPPGVVAGTLAGGAIAGTTYGISALDKATDGRLINAMMSGTKGLRSNYAYIREAADANLALGLFAGLQQVGGGIAGAVIGGATAGALAGSAAKAAAATRVAIKVAICFIWISFKVNESVDFIVYIYITCDHRCPLTFCR